MSAYDLLLLNKLTSGKKGGSNTRSKKDADKDEKDAEDGACYCDEGCSKVGDCCADFEELCEDDKRNGKGNSKGGSDKNKLLAFNMMSGDPLGMGSVDPLMAMAMGADPLMAMLMGRNKPEESCHMRCGIPGILPAGATPRPVNPFAPVRRVVPYAGGGVMNRMASVSGQAEEEDVVPISTGFSNNAGLTPDFDAKDREEAVREREQEEQPAEAGESNVMNRVSIGLGGGSARASAVPAEGRCGCDPGCSVYGICCHDYWDVCVRF